jgi:hypothetical protein
MLRKFALASSLTVLCAGIAVGAQQPTPDPQRPDATQQQPAGQQPEAQQTRAATEQTTTVEGCVYHERDIPGRTPNVAERAGVLEDYILVASTASGSKPGATGTTGTTGTTGSAASGAAKMFKLEHKPDHQLSAKVGKRVQVTGKIDAERSDSTGAAAAPRQQDQSVGPDRINLPEFEITSIREAQGECPDKPQMSR